MRRELEIIKTGLHCTAVKICARDTGRLVPAAEDALRLGLEVWFCPELWNKDPDTTLRHITRAVRAARGVFGGPVTYASLSFEHVDWAMFDLISVGHYWYEPARDRYLRTLEPLLASGKPVVITEFGFRTRTGADQGGVGPENFQGLSMLLHMTPVTRRFVRARVKTVHERNEDLQARSLTRQLELLDSAGVDGAFVYTFTAPPVGSRRRPGARPRHRQLRQALPPRPARHHLPRHGLGAEKVIHSRRRLLRSTLDRQPRMRAARSHQRADMSGGTVTRALTQPRNNSADHTA